MRNLLAATCLTPVFLLAGAGTAWADTTISANSSTPVRTSTVKSGQPDNVILASGVSLTPQSGTAITIDSNNSVTNNGTITISGVSNVTGIAASAGLTGNITNTGTITLSETSTATDTDGDGDLDGPFANTSNKFGIHVGGAGTFTGTINHSGSITMIGNQSSGIAVDGTLAGSVQTTGGVTVVGTDAYGVHLHDVTGSVKILGSVSVQGQNAIGVALDGDIGGALVLQNAINATGYRSTTAPDDVSKLDTDDLLQGGPAVSVAGNVAGGILLDVPPTASTTDTDVDKDGIPDANESSSAIASYGGAPALRIGSTTEAITIGKISGQSYGLINRGGIAGNGVYAGVASTGVQIAGRGQNVTVSGGLSNVGSIAATANTASATALLLGAGANVPVIDNSGTIIAGSTSGANTDVRGLEIDAGATVTTLNNSGSISATLAGTDTGTAAAIRDASGTLTTITNTGAIGGTLTNSSTATATNGYALDLRANTSGVSFTQSQSATTDAAAPAMAGRIITGSGNDNFQIKAGTYAGTASFGAGDDTLAVSGTSSWAADVDFGSGAAVLTLADSATYDGDTTFGSGAATITLGGTSSFTGLVTPGAGGLSVAVNGGSFKPSNSGALALSALTVGGSGTIGFNVDTAAGTASSYQVAGAASFAPGAKIDVTIKSLLTADKTYQVVKAGTLTGGANVSLVDNIPFLYTASVTSDQTANTVSVSLARKTAADLGLNRAEGSAFPAVYAAAGTDSGLTATLLGVADSSTLQNTVDQLLPDHSGGLFLSATQGSRAVARGAADPDGTRATVGNGPLAVWLQESAWHTHKGRDDNSGSYKIDGNGFTGGAELHAGDAGSFGLAASYIVNDIDDGGPNDKLFGYQYEGTAYWRGGFGGLQASAHASYAQISFESRRGFDSSASGSEITHVVNDKWSGNLFSAGGVVAYRVPLGAFDLKPNATIDYYNMREKAHSEEGDAVTALSLDSRTSSELLASGTVILGYGIGKPGSPSGWSRFEIEGGWRQVAGGSLGDTTARFTGGSDFTIAGDKLKSGYVARVRATGGNASLRIGGEVGAEQIQGSVAVGARASVRVAF